MTHYVLFPILLVNGAAAIWLAVRAHGHDRLTHGLAVAVAFALLLLNFKIRTYVLRVQDRVIRLEERLRISAVVSAKEAYALSMSQLIALRFAPDTELPELVRRTLAEGLDRQQIKQAICDWRPDPVRI